MIRELDTPDDHVAAQRAADRAALLRTTEALKRTEQERDALKGRLAQARASILNQCGDNLCWLADPEVGKALPEAEFLESCRRYRNQLAAERGEFTGGMTIAQLEAALEKAQVFKALAVRLAIACEEHHREYHYRTPPDLIQDARALLELVFREDRAA
jgi:hypothetical protein